MQPCMAEDYRVYDSHPSLPVVNSTTLCLHHDSLLVVRRTRVFALGLITVSLLVNRTPPSRRTGGVLRAVRRRHQAVEGDVDQPQDGPCGRAAPAQGHPGPAHRLPRLLPHAPH